MIGWYIKVSRPKGKDGDGERWSSGGVSPTMNAFENQTSTRAVVVVVHCYENHAQDSRVKPLQGGVCSTIGSSNANSAGVSGNNPLILCKVYSIGGGQTAECRIFADEFCQTLDTMNNMRAIVIFNKPADASRQATASSVAPTGKTHMTES